MQLPAKLLSLLAIPHLALVIIVCQFAVYLCAQGPGGTEHVYNVLALIPDKVLYDHEWWRLFTFLVLPPVTNPVFLILSLYFFWLMSSALESKWGIARFNLYYLIGWAALVVYGLGMALAAEHGAFGHNDFPLDDDSPLGPLGHDDTMPSSDDMQRHASTALGAMAIGNSLIATSIFLAFAWLFPQFTIYLFFIIPVQVRWLALATWVGYLYALCIGSAVERLMVLAAITNFVVFFGDEIFHRMRRSNAAMTERVRELAPSAFHLCAVCGATERKNPDLTFRICTDCQPARELCVPCLKKGHDHVVPPPPHVPQVRTRW